MRWRSCWFPPSSGLHHPPCSAALTCYIPPTTVFLLIGCHAYQRELLCQSEYSREWITPPKWGKCYLLIFRVV